MTSLVDSWSVAGELSLDLMQRLSAADLEDMLKVTLLMIAMISTTMRIVDFFHPDFDLNFRIFQDCGVESAIHRHKIIDAAINGTDDESFADR